ncbi:serine-rich coiled-coil domain-containing protein 2 isoform X2 [Syngnathus scovelli]|uniref:serine-rich coiled-coil domain-containing protein 2 isoform X2 n=1 Tax=Syngnathus scovelli TaxID=161590 RepID=UPI00210F3587|nr:serine-rich coiled-coil domain-containing protein 2 isoform X1 [Syngnathus scovelli]
MSSPTMPTLVSRLPKFGSWSKSSSPTPTAARLPNGFYHHPGPAAGDGTADGPAPSARWIGTICTPAELRKRARAADGGRQDIHNDTAPRHAHPQKSAVDPKTSNKSFPAYNAGLPVPKSGLPVSRTGLPVLKNKLSVSKSRLTGSKQNLSGLSGSKLRPPQRSANSDPTLSSSPGSGCGSLPTAARSLSTRNLRSAPPSRLAKGDGSGPRGPVVQRRTSPVSPPPSPCSKAGHNQSVTSCVQAEPLEGQKKPLLPALRANGVSYKLSRPSLAKQARTAAEEASRARAKTTARTPSSTGSSPERTPEASQGGPRVLAETLDDMSLSSGSSVDHDRTDQEYMDDFDNLGNGGESLLRAVAHKDDQGTGRWGAGVTEATRRHFLDNALDWSHETPAGDGANHLSTFSHHSRSSPFDYHEQGGSSLDLSPSDSCGSGGIYMWDEEGLEPLGGASPLIGPISAFDSDADSSDGVTHLDSCDLDEDDLMLDGDFTDDISLHGGGQMSRPSASGQTHVAHPADGDGTRRRLLWGSRDSCSDDGSLTFLRLPIEEAGHDDGQDDTSPDGILNLDLSPERDGEVVAEDLAQDMGALRSQLELLQQFLLQDAEADDDTLTTDTLSPEDGNHAQVGAPVNKAWARSSAVQRRPAIAFVQVEALLQEVRQLKEDLRNKEQIISQLTHQLAHAPPTDWTGKTEQHTQTSVVGPAGESVASQTPWRERTAFPPPAFLSPPWQYQRSRPYGGRPKPSIPSHLARKRVETLVAYFSDTPCHRYFAPPSHKSRTH